MEDFHGVVAAGLLPYLRMSWLPTLRYTLPQRGGSITSCRNRFHDLPLPHSGTFVVVAHAPHRDF